MDELTGASPLEELAQSLMDIGMEVADGKAEACDTLLVKDVDGNWHECWESAGGEVNVTFSMTPRHALLAMRGGGSDPDEGTPLWKWVEKQAKAIINDCEWHMEGCNEDELKAYSEVIGNAVGMKFVAECMQEKGYR